MTYKKLEDLTLIEARQWLLDNDREGYELWKTAHGDLHSAIRENLRDFGYLNQLGTVIIVDQTCIQQ